ncbi:MAG: hypothetical protein BAJATHORv1_50040 [Candidatus Thorarchaeota archaeon]|nr:MAG: hypothetical protein BAJATHORv1_50040 [Candidatus Thorarchaeota archaeon]
MTKILLVLCGIPASGKTTLANLISKHLALYNFELVSTDEWRDEKYYAEFMPEKEHEVRKNALKKTEELLRAGRNVLHDDTNYYTSMRHELLELANQYQCRFGIIHVATPFETAVTWNAQRQSPLPELVIERIAKRFDNPGSKYSWDEPIKTIDMSRNEVTRELEELQEELSKLSHASKEEAKTTISESEKRDQITRKVMADFLRENKEYRGMQSVLDIRHQVLEIANNQNLTLIETEQLLRDLLEDKVAAS